MSVSRKTGTAEPLGQVEGAAGQAVALGHAARRQRDDRVAARRAPPDELHVALARGRRAARGRAQALHVHDHQRHLAHDRQADVLAVEADARPGGGCQRAGAGHGRADAHADGGDLVLGLDGDAADFRQLADHVQQQRGRRGDGIAGEEVAPGVQRAAGDRRGAVDEFTHDRVPP